MKISHVQLHLHSLDQSNEILPNLFFSHLREYSVHFLRPFVKMADTEPDLESGATTVPEPSPDSVTTLDEPISVTLVCHSPSRRPSLTLLSNFLPSGSGETSNELDRNFILLLFLEGPGKSLCEIVREDRKIDGRDHNSRLHVTGDLWGPLLFCFALALYVL